MPKLGLGCLHARCSTDLRPSRLTGRPFLRLPATPAETDVSHHVEQPRLEDVGNGDVFQPARRAAGVGSSWVRDGGFLCGPMYPGVAVTPRADWNDDCDEDEQRGYCSFPWTGSKFISRRGMKCSQGWRGAGEPSVPRAGFNAKGGPPMAGGKAERICRPLIRAQASSKSCFSRLAIDLRVHILSGDSSLVLAFAMSLHSHAKKRKRPLENPSGPDTSRPTAVYRPTAGRSHTLTIALPGSIIANCQRHDIKTALAGQIARACAVFCVDEIVIFNDGQSQKNQDRRDPRFVREDENSGYTGFSDPDSFLYHLLSYLETPPNLRVALFELHPNLSKAGQLPSLDMPHHLRGDEWCQFREGVVLDSGAYNQNTHGAPPRTPAPNKSPGNSKKRKGPDAPTASALVEAGLPYPINIATPTPIAPHTRVTLKFSSEEDPGEYHNLQAAPVAPSLPREERGYYWGYQTRQAGSLGAVFTECPYDGGYDVSVGTSERGVPLTSILPVDGGAGGAAQAQTQARLPGRFEHLLLVFGGVAGLEAAANADQELKDKGIKGSNVGDMFDFWVNLVPEQGSRTIRCEEAVWCGLMGLRSYVASNGKP